MPAGAAAAPPKGSQEVSLQDAGDMTDLEWVGLMQQINSAYAQEMPIEKLKRKLAAEPLIPIGQCVLPPE